MLNNLIELPIWVTNLDIDTDEILSVAKDLFEKNPDVKHFLEKGDAQSSYTLTQNLTEYSEFAELRSLVLPEAKKYWDEYGLDCFAQPQIMDSWINRHGKGGSTFPHFHAQSPIVGVFYLQFEEGNGNLFMEDPLHYHKAHEPRPNWESEIELPIQQNDLILFPGYVKHWTGINEIDKERVIISFNFGK